MIRNPLIEDIRSNVHARPIPWKGLNRAHLVTEEEVTSFEGLGKLSLADRRAQVTADAAQYANTVSQVLLKDSRDDLVKYLLLFIADYAGMIPAFAEALAKHDGVLQALSKLLARGDEQVKQLAASALAAVVGYSSQPKLFSDALFLYVVTDLVNSKDDLDKQDLGAQILAKVLQSGSARAEFKNYESQAVPELKGLALNAPLQLQYSSLLVIWILSFDKTTCKRFINEFNIVDTLIAAAKKGVKEKIVRLCVATLANLIKLQPKSAIPVIIAEGQMQDGRVLPERKWNDEELVADLDFVNSTLVAAFESMTTFQEYLSELETKRLRWSPVHRNRAFWIENIDEFKKENWKYLKEVVNLAVNSTDPVTLAVACHDITEIVHQAPESVQVIAQAGGKVRILQLIGDGNTEVRYEALRASQMMLQYILA